ncbi:MAG: penicillin-binding protein activator LpoB [Bdellovibrionales bacterium]|nr:penicillin-binding protein activator LpoB [Bdellovibrionales bacterium]
MKSLFVIATSLVLMSLTTGCGPRQFSEGSYDEDVNEANLLDDRWSESDMQAAVRDLVKSATNHYAISSSKRPPVVMVTKLQNKTSEHIDTQSVMDMVRVELMRGGRVSFVDKAARDDIAEEYEYQNSGMVNRETKKGKGNQVGADFIINGRLDAINKEVGRKKTVYYKITLNMTNLSTGVIVWSDYKQIRKRFKKRAVGL